MSKTTIKAALRNVYECGLMKGNLTILWHAGEPLVLPLEFYREVFDEVNSYKSNEVNITNHIQTNGMLLTDEYCNLFKEYNVTIGLSLDGPEFLHNKNRVTRTGKGTFDESMEGLRLLREHNVNFNVITVVTDMTIDYPEELYKFYLDNKIKSVGLNVEEIEGPNLSSSLFENGIRYANFLKKLLHLSQLDRKVHIREFEKMKLMILSDSGLFSNSENSPFSMINVAVDGMFSTFSPEFLGIKDEDYGNFIVGNVHEGLITDALSNPVFNLLSTEIGEGIKACSRECEYFSVCGGGAPSNKYFENHSLSSTTTKYCTYNKKLIADAVLEYFETILGLDGQAMEMLESSRFQ